MIREPMAWSCCGPSEVCAEQPSGADASNRALGGNLPRDHGRGISGLRNSGHPCHTAFMTESIRVLPRLRLPGVQVPPLDKAQPREDWSHQGTQLWIPYAALPWPSLSTDPIPAQPRTGAPHFKREHKWGNCKEQLLEEHVGSMGHLCPAWGSPTTPVPPGSVSSPGHESVPYLRQLSKKVEGCGCRKSSLESWLWMPFPEGKFMGRS